MQQPRVVFLDAVGTLFGVRGSVGTIYAELALQYGVEVSANRLDLAFGSVFKAAPPPAFPGTPSSSIQQQEYRWWYDIARQTFADAGELSQFKHFDRFFASLYDHFATAAPWYIYSDVVPALKLWRDRGVNLGIISNFDSRLNEVLVALKLQHYFSSVTISSIVGAAKPNPAIFLAALSRHGVSAAQAWHIGDSLRADYHGARALGIKAYWLQRRK